MDQRDYSIRRRDRVSPPEQRKRNAFPTAETVPPKSHYCQHSPRAVSRRQHCVTNHIGHLRNGKVYLVTGTASIKATVTGPRPVSNGHRKDRRKRSNSRSPINFRRPTPKALPHPLRRSLEGYHHAMRLRAAQRGLQHAEQRLGRMTSNDA